MADCIKAKSKTNQGAGSYKAVNVDCNLLWSKGHAFSYMRLSEEGDEEHSFDLMDCYASRAKRIAATYARFYLETEEGCDPKKKGRFYWMALGALASKTVGCILETWQLQASFLSGSIVDKGIDVVIDKQYELKQISEGLALGNLWLFMDVATWHWGYANYPQHYFEGMACWNKRNTDKLLDNCDGSGGVHTTVTKNLPWADYALPKVNHLKTTSYIEKGMRLVKEIENAPNSIVQRKQQLAHLIEIANHEQEMILQKLIYNHEGFKSWLKLERSIRTWSIEARERAKKRSEAYLQKLNKAENFWEVAKDLFSPKEHALILHEVSKSKVYDALVTYQFVFGAACDTDDGSLKNVAPDALELETLGALEDAEKKGYKSRMGWIGSVAADFHHNMINKTDYMESELKTIASWVEEPDFSIFCIAKETGAFQ